MSEKEKNEVNEELKDTNHELDDETVEDVTGGIYLIPLSFAKSEISVDTIINQKKYE